MRYIDFPEDEIVWSSLPDYLLKWCAFEVNSPYRPKPQVLYLIRFVTYRWHPFLVDADAYSSDFVAVEALLRLTRTTDPTVGLKEHNGPLRDQLQDLLNKCRYVP